MEIVDVAWIKAHLTNTHGEKARLARAMGVKPDVVTKIFNGTRSLKIEEARRAADFITNRSADSTGAIDHERTDGFGEGVQRFEFRPSPEAEPSAVPVLRSIYGPHLGTPETFLAKRAHPAFGIFAGDVLVVDMSRTPNDGELALVTDYDDEGNSTTELRRVLRPYLLSGELPQATIRIDASAHAPAIRNPVVGVIRGVPTPETQY